MTTGNEIYDTDDTDEICEYCHGEGYTEDSCGACNGSGEGSYDGSICRTCKGSGVEYIECDCDC